MSTRRLQGDADGPSNTRKSTFSKQHPQSTTLYSLDSQFGGDELSVAGSSISSPGSQGMRPLRASSSKSKREEHGSRSTKKPPSPRPKMAAAFNTSQVSSKSINQRQRGPVKSKPKPAWLTTPNDTPRSEVSDNPSSIPPKPSLADFLDFETDNYNKDTQQEREENRFLKDSRKEKAEIGNHADTVENKSNGEPLLQRKSRFCDKVDSIENNGNLRTNAVQPQHAQLRKDLLIPIDIQHEPMVSHPGLHNKANSNATQVKKSVGTKKTFKGYSDTPEDRITAATNIQVWYRRLRNRKKAGQAALRRLMENKKEEMESRMSNERFLHKQEQSSNDAEYLKKKRREEKARQARLAAIEELRNKREGSGNKTAIKKDNNLVFLQPSGKVTKDISKASSLKKSRTALDESKSTLFKRAEEGNRPSTSSSVGRKVNEIFEENKSRSSKAGVEEEEEEESTSDKSGRESAITLKESKTTYDDLMDTLKELESDTVEPTNYAFTRAKGYQERLDVHGQSVTTSYSVTVPQEEQRFESTQGPLLSADKLQTIMNFLDEVERAEEDIRSEVTRQSRESAMRTSFPAWNNGKIEFEKEITPSESASQVLTDIDNAISAQKQELTHKNESLNMLQRALKQQKEFSSLHLQEVEKEHKEQINLQRKEYESTIQRHLSFIDQLIDDKKALSSRCEVLVKKLKETDEKYSTKIKKMEDDHSVELKKQKELMEAAEKLRREKWVQEKTKQIKEVTVKGLEPDIQRLIAKHKAEIKRLKAAHQGELLEADERAGRKYIRQIEETRARLEQEKDVAVQKEREIAKQRFQKQLEHEEESYQQQRQRLYAEIKEEKERIGKQMQSMREELKEEKDASEISSKQSVFRMQEDHQKAVEEMERRHLTELNNMKEQLEIEKQQWIENHMKKQDVYLLAKERELKENVREARDKEIEMVIARLENETAKAQEENNKAAENRIKRIIEKYENEMKELERSEKLTHEKYSKLKVQMQEQEGDDLRLKSQIKQKEQEVTDMKRLTDQLQLERGKVSDIIRQEFADRLVTLEEDNKRLRTEMSEMRARHRIEIDRISNEKDIEMEEVHKRVKHAVSKKEETTNLLRQQMKAAEKRAEQLEMLLAEQRKKILS